MSATPLTPEDLRAAVRAEFRALTERSGRVHLDTVRQRVVYEHAHRELEREEFVGAIVESALQAERRRKGPDGARLYETVRTAEGKRMAKALMQLTLDEAAQDISRREQGVEANRLELRRRHNLFHEALRRAQARGLNPKTTRYANVLSDAEVERIWTAA